MRGCPYSKDFTLWVAQAFASNLQKWVSDLEHRLHYVREFVTTGHATRWHVLPAARKRGTVAHPVEAAEGRGEEVVEAVGAVWLGALFFPESLYPTLCREYAIAKNMALDTPMRVHCHFPAGSAVAPEPERSWVKRVVCGFICSENQALAGQGF